MPKTKLRGLLEELQDELEKTASIEPGARDLLHEVMDDIRGVLETDPAPQASAAESDDGESMSDRLRGAVADFEAEHPRLSFAVERLVKSLSDIGI